MKKGAEVANAANEKAKEKKPQETG